MITTNYSCRNRAGSLVVWLQLNVSGFRSVLAHGWHGACLSMRTTGAFEGPVPASPGSQRRLRSCMHAVVCPFSCMFCCTVLTFKCQDSSGRVL
jgi:hypothetical protein